ncbi:MAG: ABC transporter ATP-binding protein, partial [Desulfobacterales bacterium]|nr:ABC transporter ATP-binding protein [Desulfobacterales bacterium]
VSQGEILSVIGPNGAGKTSLVRAVYKNLAPASGRILIRDKNESDNREQDIWKTSGNALACRMAVVRQTVDPVPMTVAAYVLLGRLPYFNRFQFFESGDDKALAESFMDLTGIRHLADATMDKISGGERQLAAVARALTQEPDLLVLDEPTAHLDITHQARILDLIREMSRERGLTALMVIHDLNLAAEYSDHLVLIDKQAGRIHASGSPEAVLTQENIEAVYQTRVVVKKNPSSGSPCVFLKRRSL